MATTSLWAVRGNVRDVVQYVKNADKTSNPDYDLKKVIDYAKDGDKTEKQFYVTGINCSPAFAYQRMNATKERYGKKGGIVAYHGYQSFKPGEITPDLCHKIGVLTAKALWGDRFEVVVATHLSGSSALHNHFVVNSVSFQDGKKYRCQKGTHLKIREVSDHYCRQYHLSVITDPIAKKMPRQAWMAGKAGKPTHASILRRDIDRAIYHHIGFKNFMTSLENMGYVVMRDEDYGHISVITEGWKKPVRLDSLGENYTMDAIRRRMMENIYEPSEPAVSPPAKREAWNLLEEMEALKRYSIIDMAFMLIFELLNIPYPDPITLKMHYPKNHVNASPCISAASVYCEKYTREVRLMSKYNIHTKEEVNDFVKQRDAELSEWESKRKQIDNKRRRITDPEEKKKNSAMRHEITEIMIGLRRERNLAAGIWGDVVKIAEMGIAEKDCEDRIVPTRTQKNIEFYERER